MDSSLSSSISLLSSSSSSSSKKRLWSSEEDKTLTGCVQEHGPRNWNKLARISGLEKDGNSCRFRWVNHLKPKVNKGNFTKEEDNIIVKAQNFYGNQWSKISLKLPRRTDNQVKNRWNSYLSKKESISEEEKESVSKENGRPNHSEFHQNISHELFPDHEFHSDFFLEFFHQDLSPKPFLENEINQVFFPEPFAEQESYQYLPHEPFLLDSEFSQDFFPEAFSEDQYLSHQSFPENEFYQDFSHEPFAEQESYQYLLHDPFLIESEVSQDFFPEAFLEYHYLSHEPFPENEFQQDFSHELFSENEFHLWDFPSAFSW